MFEFIINKLFPNYYKSNYKVFVFDLDHTITNKHTGGHYVKGDYKKYITSEMLTNVRKMFMKIKLDGNMIYINSRGIAGKVYNFCVDTGLMPFITGIYAANYDGKKYSHKGIMAEYKMGNRKWHEIKSLYLNKIMKKENVKTENIYYFDDSERNVNFAKNIGFMNSYLVNSNEYMNVYDKYNLINVFNNVY
jgi:hypothetical protein